MNVWLPLIIAIVPGGVAAYFAYRAATRTTQTTAQVNERIAAQQAALEEHRLELERTRIDAEAYERAKTIYEAALTQLEKQGDRVQRQVDRLNEQLLREQDLSAGLREQIRVLETTVAELRKNSPNDRNTST